MAELTLVYGRYNELVFMDVLLWFINQRSHHSGDQGSNLPSPWIRADPAGIPESQQEKKTNDMLPTLPMAVLRMPIYFLEVMRFLSQ